MVQKQTVTDDRVDDGGESVRDALERVFGPRVLEPPLFYEHAPALRFELSRHGSHIDQFTQAYDRVREIAAHLLGDTPRLTAVLVCYDPDVSVRELVAGLRACGVRTARPRTCWKDPWVDGEHRTLLAFSFPRSMLDGLLWAAVAADLAVRPRVPATVYIADLERGVLLHPYDDRGMDVIAGDRDQLAAWYHQFHDYLLAYDRERMQSFFP